MSEHRWGEPDKDGVRACLRAGCTVRWNGHDNHLFTWQRRKGTHWRHKDSEPLPACTGTDAPEATTCVHDWVTEFGVLYCRKCPAPPPAPSPLEVVRNALEHLRRWGEDTLDVRHADAGLAALATLEESIRAEEREACAMVADTHMRYCEDVHRRMATHDGRERAFAARDSAEVIGRNIRARGKR